MRYGEMREKRPNLSLCSFCAGEYDPPTDNDPRTPDRIRDAAANGTLWK